MAGEPGSSWLLSSGQFDVMWSATGLDRMPYPLHHIPGGKYADDAFRIRTGLEQWYRDNDDQRLRASIDVLRSPDLSVSVFVPTADGAHFQRRGAVRGRVAVVADQAPERHRDTIPDDASTTGDIDLRVQVAGAAPDLGWLTRKLLRDLPGNEPGRTSVVTAHAKDLHQVPDAQQSSVLQNTAVSGAALMRRILARRTACGYVVVHGPRVGADDSVLDSLTWVDVADDGRYLYAEDDKVTLRAADRDLIAGELEQRVRRVLDSRTT
ncbi:ESX secretion-associated protein EspG [Rhodococcus triatomae]|uniref:EspG family protein n=1 Tax=Rhodococcus triatomae TaxID=300028 RepID=A0A1G8H6L1_9NOCA|nr:ESX secretion-associated protein EspG [Rhodococcus triatomae]QNG20191.1 ESX secretion-associated protein EspG [Rhodococcus triatomae]QNG23894.1 ESX secretion-associated protein EspG [Rhodococcus triatomae]SDI02297.1 EspG family protein [Rhodococcus triatomae]